MLTDIKLFMTSSPMGAYRSTAAPDFKGLNPANGMVEELKSYWRPDSRCLLVSAFPDEYDINDRMRADFERIFRETGLSVKCMDICDRRGCKTVISRLPSYDMVILGGGHVPTQKQFFDEIGLREALEGWDGIVMGISAGSMNCADVVYAQPEMPGEATEPSYQKFIRGLGLTDVNVLPHYQAVKDDYVDGLRLFEEITYPDSAGRIFYAIVDGSYVLQTEDIVAFDVKTQQHTIHHVALEPEEKIFAMVAGAQGLWCYTSHDRLFCWHPERGILQMLTDALGEPSAYGAAMICCLGKLWAFRFETDRCVAVDETTGVLQRYDGYAPEEAKDKIGFPSPRFRDGNIYLLPNRSAGLLIFHPETGKASCFRIPNAPDYQARHRKVYASKRPFYQSEQNMICDIATFASWMGDQEAEETASEGTACGEKIYQCVVK